MLLGRSHTFFLPFLPFSTRPKKILVTQNFPTPLKISLFDSYPEVHFLHVNVVYTCQPGGGGIFQIVTC